jgi:hypothetical protein
MDMDQAAVWLAGSILTVMGFVVIIIGILIVNNLLHKYWKPVKLFTYDSWFVNPPMIDKSVEPLEVQDGKSKEKRNA